jgi:hypothetical protein
VVHADFQPFSYAFCFADSKFPAGLRLNAGRTNAQSMQTSCPNQWHAKKLPDLTNSSAIAHNQGLVLLAGGS